MVNMTARELIRNFDKDELENILNSSYSLAETLRKMGITSISHRHYTPDLHNKIKKDKIKYKLLKVNHHPNLKINYFKTINTKEKAYWLGFLAADAYITNTRLSLQLGEKDRNLLYKFVEIIGANKEKITEYENKNYQSPSKRIIFELFNKKFVTNLTNLGFKSPKSYNLNFPNFKNEGLDMAFVLGYFDGDGTAGTTEITTCSKNFLIQIIKKFNIKNKIKQNKKIYKLNLGSELFKKLLKNYEYSLERKRSLKKYDKKYYNKKK
jgi:hypothetical protein